MNITRVLAENVVRTAAAPLDERVQLMAKQSLLNVLGTAIGASQDPAVQIFQKYSAEIGGSGIVPIPGCIISLDPLRAATAIGMAAHVDDFDDTHLTTVIHPSAACLAAAIATGAPQMEAITGDQFITAFALGCEVQIRVGLVMSPWHYDGGWHITGTVGSIGAAVTSALLTPLRSDVEGMERAITIAANMILGDREAFGSMIKSFHPGKAASNGVLAAKLAARFIKGPENLLGRSGGYFDVLSPTHKSSILNDDFGKEWHFLYNTFKPYPCGIVCHPAIDCAIALAPRVNLHISEIKAVNIFCNPLVEELTGNQNPITGLQAKFSTIHGVVAGLSDGQVGLEQYSDSRVNSADLRQLRSTAKLIVEPNCPRDSARVEVELTNGTKFSEQVEHARGSLARPLTQTELETKVNALIEPTLSGRSQFIVENVMSLTAADNIKLLMHSLVGSQA